MSNEPPSPGPGRPFEDDEPAGRPPPPDRPPSAPYAARASRGGPAPPASDAPQPPPPASVGGGASSGTTGSATGAQDAALRDRGPHRPGPGGGAGTEVPGEGGPGDGAGGGWGGPGEGGPGGGGPFGGKAPPGGGSFGGPPGGGPGGPERGGPFGAPDPLAGMAPLAPSGRRVLARLIDMVIVGIAVFLLSLAFGMITYRANSGEMRFGASFGESVLVAVLYIAYDTYLISRTGQTLGKRLLRMRVANLSDGATPTFQVSLARAAVLWLPFAFCCPVVWTAIAGGWALFDRPYRQGLHDKAARTVVVSTEDRSGR